VTEIFSFIEHAIPDKKKPLKNYGCAGQGNMDASQKTLGHPVDDVDKALNIRKHCITCAEQTFGLYQEYNYDTIAKACASRLGTGSRAFCECDAQFVRRVTGLATPNSNYDTSQCVPMGGQGVSGACCQSQSGLFAWYNKEKSDCCEGSVKSIGAC
jgi:hypothetical protein